MMYHWRTKGIAPPRWGFQRVTYLDRYRDGGRLPRLRGSTLWLGHHAVSAFWRVVIYAEDRIGNP